ncbi:MAG: beta strand repeat-containing protein, partial [Luteolibacter sp.]
MKPRFTQSLKLLAASSLLLNWAASSLNAGTLTWDTASDDGESITAGSGDWDTTTTNWNNAGTNEAWSQTSDTAALHTAVFGGSDGDYTVTLSGTVNAQSVTFNNSGYTLTGSNLNLKQNATTNGSIAVTEGKTATISSNIGYNTNKAASITVGSGGVLNLTGGAGNSQYAFNGDGTVNITASIYNANIGTMGAANLNMSGGQFLVTPGNNVGFRIFSDARDTNFTLSGGKVTVNGNNAAAPADAFFGIGDGNSAFMATMTVQEGAELSTATTSGRAGEIRISNSATSNGTLNVQGGTFNVSGMASNQIYLFKNGASEGFSASMTQSGGTVTTNGIQFGGASGTYDAGSTANLTLSGGSLYIGAQGITRGGGASALPTEIKLQGGILGASDDWSSSLDMKLGATGGGLTVQAATSGDVSKNITLSGVLSDDDSVSGALTKTGGGTLTLSGANTYSGNTTINAGTLKLGAADVIANGAGKGNVAIAATGTLDLNGFSEAINGLSGAGTVDNTAVGAATLTVGTVAGGNFSGTIQDTGGALSLIKTGGTDLILSGTNTYSGTTTINQNRLFISNSAAALSANTAVTVNNGAALVLNAGGNPTFAQSITLNSGSNLSLRSAATLSNVTLASSGIVTFNQDDSTTQALTLNSNTALGGELVVQVGGGSAAPAAVTLSGIFSGEGGSLVKIGSGTLILRGANTFDGGLTIQNGTVNAQANNAALGAGTVTLGGTGSTGAALVTGRVHANNFTINAPDSGSVVIGANGAGSGYSITGGINLNSDLTIQTFDNNINGIIRAQGTIAGGITGTGNVVLDNLGLAA